MHRVRGYKCDGRRTDYRGDKEVVMACMCRHVINSHSVKSFHQSLTEQLLCARHQSGCGESSSEENR